MPRKTTAKKSLYLRPPYLKQEDIEWLDRMHEKADLPPYLSTPPIVRRRRAGTNSFGPM